MKIAIYYPWMHLTSGIERTILEITKIKDHEFTIFTNHFDSQNTYPQLKNCKIIELDKVPVKRNIRSVLKAAVLIAKQKLPLQDFDLLMVHSDGLADLIMLRNHKLPNLCICHTPLRPVFDEQYQTHVLLHKPISYRLVFRVFAMLFAPIDRLLWQKYQTVIFNSHETQRRAIRGRLIHQNSPNITIIHPGTHLPKPFKNPVFEPYFLLPGRVMWTKNIELAIKAFTLFKRKNPNLKKFTLTIAGQVDDKSRPLYSHLKDIVGKRQDIAFVINPTDKQLTTLYHRCWAVLSCAFNEDWGITLLEGNAHGKPTIAINRGGPTESQIQNKTGYLVNDTTASISNAMLKLASNPSITYQMGAAAYHQVKNLSWTRYRQKITQLLTTPKTNPD